MDSLPAIVRRKKKSPTPLMIGMEIWGFGKGLSNCDIFGGGMEIVGRLGRWDLSGGILKWEREL